MKEKFDIAYITTFINTDYIYKLIDSIIINNKTIKTMLIVVNQTKQFLNLEKYSNSNNVIVELQTEKQSLSKARNVGIECLIEHEFDVRYVSFPDDDSSFDVNFFEKFNNIIIDNNNYLIDVYGERTNNLYLKNNLEEGVLVINNCERIAMSVNMIINFNTIKKILFFDEKMGIGAFYGAGEDTDYFLRCVAVSGAFIYTKQLWNYHPQYEKKHNEMPLENLLKKYRNYGRGVIYMNYKHNLYTNAVKLCFSALGGSFVALLHLDFKLMIARLYAFYVRSFTFIGLLTGILK